MKWLLYPKHNYILQSRYFSFGSYMASWSSRAVRSTFIEYFKSQGHVFVPSSSVIPQKGDGTYFTNAGMNQFKPLILGELDPRSIFQNLVRAVNSQKCIRVGGKHNDLDDVGHDLTHHTFFEMLGNWSFGDYFKADACQMAYELLTKHYGIPVDRLYFTYFAGDEHMNLPRDEECKNVWLSLGIPDYRILPFGVKDNFWDMGLMGPCGPCTEIHFDHLGSKDASSKVNTGSPDVVEIWNLVFMQYNRQKDQSLQQLRIAHVDTGMGLERMTAVLSGTADNYSTDLFLPLFDVIQKYSGCPTYKSNKEVVNTSYRILADHTRMFTVAIGDGLMPSYNNLGHKLRSVMYRCIHLCRNVFHVEPEVLLPPLVSAVIQSLGSTYPELVDYEKRVIDVVKAIVEYHDRQKEQANKVFNKMLSRSAHNNKLSVETIAALEKGTYGIPMSVELIGELATARGLTVDMTGYENLLQERKMTTTSDPRVAAHDVASFLVTDLISRQVPQTDDRFKYHYASIGETQYDLTTMSLIASPSCIQGISSNGEIISKLVEGSPGEVILDRTCFYAESGGQEGDTGKLVSETGEFEVSDVQCHRGYVVHYGHVTKGSLKIGQNVDLTISQANREGCMRNHTATHLINSVLAELIPSTQQQGSSVTPYKLTLDFHTLTSISTSLISRIESDVRDTIKSELPVLRSVMPLDLALKLHKLKLLQNEEYPREVSIITIGSQEEDVFSRELCAGTHVMNTFDLEDFCLTGLSTQAQNVKRMTAVTGREALQAHSQGSVVQSMCSMLQSLVSGKDVPDTDLEKIKAHLQKTVRLVDSAVERYHNGLTYSCENKARLGHLIEENNKARNVFLAFDETIDDLMRASSKKEEIMKQLVTYIHKGRQLELIAKAVRDDAHVCLENFEHKVAEAVNKMAIRLLQEMLQTEIESSTATAPLILQVDHVDISPRQMVKAVSQKAWSKVVVLVQKSSCSVHIVVSLPSFLVKHTETELNKILESLQCFGTTKGKLSSEKNGVAVYTVSIPQTNTDSVSVIQRLHDERLFSR
ncbi:hypothetical protein BsWGS_09255 [Bradybaena similaris]